MAALEFFRGGNLLQPKPGEVKFDKDTGLALPTHGVSVWNRPEGLEKFGGAYRVTQLPSELRIIQRAKNPNHFEIVPVKPMTLVEYEEALNKIVLVRV
jgi:hypothetical protein